LSLVHGELLEFLLVAVTELAQVDICETAAECVHFCCIDGIEELSRGCLGLRAGCTRFDGISWGKCCLSLYVEFLDVLELRSVVRGGNADGQAWVSQHLDFDTLNPPYFGNIDIAKFC
jgi:hypothetical protein